MTILFVCVHNAGRSQMAEAFLRHLSRERGLAIRATSGGTVVGGEIDPLAVQVMSEAGISMSGQEPKLLSHELAASADRIISMGCGVEADACPAGMYLAEDWGIDDPKGRTPDEVRRIRDEIRTRVEALLEEIAF